MRHTNAYTAGAVSRVLTVATYQLSVYCNCNISDTLVVIEQLLRVKLPAVENFSFEAPKTNQILQQSYKVLTVTANICLL